MVWPDGLVHTVISLVVVPWGGVRGQVERHVCAVVVVSGGQWWSVVAKGGQWWSAVSDQW